MKISSGVKIAAIYASVFLGAGFASGRELLLYFIGFGRIGLVGIMLAGVLFATVGVAVLNICRRNGITNYHALMQHLFGERLGGIMEGLVIAFLFCLFIAMLAGAGATGREAFGFSFSAGALVIAAVVFLVLCFGLDGIVKVNLFLAPLMLLGGIFVGLFSLFASTVPTFSHFTGRGFGLFWALAAIVYASYNLVTGVPILAATSKMAATKKDALWGGILGGSVITILGICMALPLFLYQSNVINLEIPFLYIITRHGYGFRIFYLAILISAVLTTAACNAFAVQEWLKTRGFKNTVKIAAVVCILGVALSHIGFSNIVAFVYPAFGLLGLFMIIVILYTAIWGGGAKAPK